MAHLASLSPTCFKQNYSKNEQKNFTVNLHMSHYYVLLLLLMSAFKRAHNLTVHIFNRFVFKKYFEIHHNFVTIFFKFVVNLLFLIYLLFNLFKYCVCIYHQIKRLRCERTHSGNSRLEKEHKFLLLFTTVGLEIIWAML